MSEWISMEDKKAWKKRPSKYKQIKANLQVRANYESGRN